MSVVRWLGGVSKEKFDALQNEIKSLKSTDTESIDSESTVTKEELDDVRAQIQALGIVEEEEKKQMNGFKSLLNQHSKQTKSLRDDIKKNKEKIAAQEAGEDDKLEKMWQRIKKLEEAKASAFSKQNEDIQQQIKEIKENIKKVQKFSEEVGELAIKSAVDQTRQLIGQAFDTRDNTLRDRFSKRPKSARVQIGNAIRRRNSFNPGAKKSSRKITRRNTIRGRGIKLRDTIVPE